MATTRNHLAPFKEGMRPWLVLACNAIPVFGVYWLGWSAPVALLILWFDNISELGAMFAFQIRGFMRNDPDDFSGHPVLAWFFMMFLLGIPYWFLTAMFYLRVVDEDFITELHDPVVMLALLIVLVSNIIEEGMSGYGQMNGKEIRLEHNWKYSMHLVRVCAILTVCFLFTVKFMIASLALVLSYIEIYPMKSLVFFGADTTLDKENRDRSMD